MCALAENGAGHGQRHVEAKPSTKVTSAAAGARGGDFVDDVGVSHSAASVSPEAVVTVGEMVGESYAGVS